MGVRVNWVLHLQSYMSKWQLGGFSIVSGSIYSKPGFTRFPTYLWSWFISCYGTSRSRCQVHCTMGIVWLAHAYSRGTHNHTGIFWGDSKLCKVAHKSPCQAPPHPRNACSLSHTRHQERKLITGNCRGTSGLKGLLPVLKSYKTCDQQDSLRGSPGSWPQGCEMEPTSGSAWESLHPLLPPTLSLSLALSLSEINKYIF